MAESITQPEMDHPSDEVVETVEIAPTSNTHVSENSIQPLEDSLELSLSHDSAPIIWTPRFIVIFALTLVVGLSVASLLTQGMVNANYPPQAVLLTLVMLALAGCITVVLLASSLPVRMGSIFG